jgi:DNA-binding response OmpR family regulator
MTTNLWAAYPATYRAREIKIMAGWISSGESGSVVGLSGCGRSNLLGFLCRRPEVLQTYLLPEASPVALIQVDLNNLPASNLSTLYRVILRSFYRVRDQFDPTLAQKITTLYQENRMERDPFLPQSGLQELLVLFQAEHVHVVLVLNRFDRFCQIATLQMINTLRGLRDDFKDTLCYIAGMSQEAAYLPDPTILGDMYELLDNYICWLGTMNDDDARNLIARATRAAHASPSEADVIAMLALTGGYPALLRAVCYWWLATEKKPAHPEWVTTLLAERSIQHRLAKIWAGLTQEEQFVLSELQKLQMTVEITTKRQLLEDKTKPLQKIFQDFATKHHDILSRLAEKGVCARAETGWRITADLLADYVAGVKERGRGRIWLEEQTGEVFQGQTLIKDLTALGISVLSFLVKHPRIRHTKTDLIVNTWPDELCEHGVTDNSLYQVISTLRKTIEPNPSRPAYLLTWRGKPEGGYQFFPEGRPG